MVQLKSAENAWQMQSSGWHTRLDDPPRQTWSCADL